VLTFHQLFSDSYVLFVTPRGMTLALHRYSIWPRFFLALAFHLSAFFRRLYRCHPPLSELIKPGKANPRLPTSLLFSLFLLPSLIIPCLSVFSELQVDCYPPPLFPLGPHCPLFFRYIYFSDPLLSPEHLKLLSFSPFPSVPSAKRKPMVSVFYIELLSALTFSDFFCPRAFHHIYL